VARTRLFSARSIANECNVSKDYIHKLERDGIIPEPIYMIDHIKGWDNIQLEEIKKIILERKR